MASAPILVLDETDSTNSEAKRRVEAGERGPLWITATRQSAGRGRRGRTWETGSGNLAATSLFTTALRPAEAAQVSFVAALAVADTAALYAPTGLVSLKWPNDLLIDGSKAAGILVESGAVSGEGLWVAVGIGINLAAAPMTSERPATTFADHMRAPPPAPLEALEHLAEAFDGWRALWEHSGFPSIADAWTARAHGLGERCVARLADSVVEGVAEGLEPDGALRLRIFDGRLLRITAGDVFF